jgi:hypothetical protein
MSDARYQFLPWVRRGLASRVPVADAPTAVLAPRANVSVGITLTSIAEQTVNLALFGPGDVVGIDPRMIVRTDPRPLAADVEPNYMPLIEFDPPDFPWMFTPAKPSADDKLRPWCVLVVVDMEVVAAPIGKAGAPLPTIDVPATAVATELPDLSESWAWAHTQLLTDTSTNIAGQLATNPERNVSRLIAPRRLEPNKRYAACLVPAFDIGVVRGLGAVPDPTRQAKPAWDIHSPARAILPVYFHWEFATGPAGDFESLARALTPYKVTGRVGLERMYIGNAGDGMPAMDAANPSAYVDMDGALRAPSLSSGTLNDIPQPVRDSLQQTLNAPAKISQTPPTGGGTTGTPVSPLGPPLYGEWHAKIHSITPTAPTWFREENLDIRARAAAGLGAEVIRANQEEFAQACWEQVDKILEANALLSRARLAIEANARAHAKSVAPMPPDRLLQLSSPLHARVMHTTVTVRNAVAATSLPNATTDPALRRLTSAQRPVLKSVMRRAGIALPASAGARVTTAQRLATGALAVDPSGFVPSGILGVTGISTATIPATGDTPVDLSVVGLPVSIPASMARSLRATTAALAIAPKPVISLRGDIRTVGLVTEANITRTRELAATAPILQASVLGGLDALLTATSKNPGLSSILLTAQPTGAFTADALDVNAKGQVVIRTPAGQPAVHVATVDEPMVRSNVTSVGNVIATLPPNSLNRTATPEPATVQRSLVGTAIVPPTTIGAGTKTPIAATVPVTTKPTTIPPVATTGGVTAGGIVTGGIATGGTVIGTAGGVIVAAPPSVTVLPPVKDPAVISVFETAFRAIAPKGVVGPTVPAATFVAFDMTAVKGSIVQKTDPRVVIPARIKTMIHVGSTALIGGLHDRVTVSPQTDRVMAFPQLAISASAYLARLDQTRFLPGVDEIPNDAMTLVETNPRFVEAFLVGLNHEMNRELLWRGYPTDQRGTPFQHFWTWADGGNDIPPIHQWATTAALGGTARGGAGGQIVLLVRGRLLRRYPNTVIYAWRAKSGLLMDPPGPGDQKQPVFAGLLDPDIVYVGFDLTDADLKTGDGWFFVLQEQPTEPRFGFDQPPATGPLPTITDWSDATWAHTGTAGGAYLHIAGNSLANAQHNGASFVANAAHLAAITMQRPMRVAFNANELVNLP